MAYHWPSETAFTFLELDVEPPTCQQCGHGMHICGQRERRLLTLQGPWQLRLKLRQCPDSRCAAQRKIFSPAAEMAISMPWWSLGWDVFAWIGQRRLSRHWSVPQIVAELHDGHQIQLSDDAVEKNIRRYQVMLAARHQDLEHWRHEYRAAESLQLSIDGLQPEKGHETLYVVRELGRKRVWFAEPLVSSAESEVRRLLVRARELAEQLGKPVSCWMSDKQEAFVRGIAAEFNGVPHRYCQNHFLRDLAKPVLEQDSHTKVRMRSKVRGLRAIEREVLKGREPERPDPKEVSHPGSEATTPERCAERCAGAVVLDYCAAVRGILNNDQGGPLHPPGIRMAEALTEVRDSLERNVAAKKGGLRKANWRGYRAASNAGWRKSKRSRKKSVRPSARSKP